jgi:hypothetical protein
MGPFQYRSAKKRIALPMASKTLTAVRNIYRPRDGRDFETAAPLATSVSRNGQENQSRYDVI